MGVMGGQLKRLSSLFIAVAVLNCSAFAQIRTISNVVGLAPIVNITPEDARLKAIEAAKVEALRLAGAQEWVQSFDFMEKKEANNKFDEFFHSMTSVQTMGNVISWKMVREQKKMDNLNNILYEVTIDADVKLYETRPDPEFVIGVEGIKPVYQNENDMTFNVMAKKEGFLNVYILDQQSQVVKLFPNDRERDNKLTGGNSYAFPRTRNFKYEVFTDLKEENNYVIFLFTRRNQSFDGKDFSGFIEHVYTLEPADRFLKMEKILIVKQ
jgi:hypothetical protein